MARTFEELVNSLSYLHMKRVDENHYRDPETGALRRRGFLLFKKLMALNRKITKHTRVILKWGAVTKG
jgi:hypothetical protein